MKIRTALNASFLLGASMVALASPAFAQGAPAKDDGAASDEIIVRAQRIEQRLQDVPVAVTPVTAKELENKRLHDLVQMTLAVPSLEVTTDNAFTLRGVGSQIFSENVDSSVGVAVDDVSLGVPIFMSNAAFVDVQQVEALTGPQGLLFGRNSSAGLLNIVTNRPKLKETSGELSLEYDNRDKAPGGHFGIVATGVLNVPVGENAALRFNILESDQDPVTLAKVNKSPNAQLKQQRLMGKVKFLWEPTSNSSLYIIGDYSRERGAGGIWDDTWRQAGVGGNDLRNTTADGAVPGPENLIRGLNGENYRSVDTFGIASTFTYELSPNVTLSNIFAWRAYNLALNLDSDNSSSLGLDVNHRVSRYDQFSNELRLAFKGDKIDGQVGLYGFRSRNTSKGDFDGTAGTPIPHFIFGQNEFTLTARSLAAYGQFNFHATEQLQFLAGARVTNDRIGVSAISDNYPQTLVFQPFGPFGPPALPIPLINIFGPVGQPAYTLNRTNTNFSYKVGVQYNFDKDIMVYATWGTGYKGPAYATNLVTLAAPKFDDNYPYIKPETVDSLEVGLKGMFFDRMLRLNVAGFISNFKNFQTQVFDSTGLSIVGNAEGVRSAGVEINSSLRPTKGLTLNYNATFSDSHFTKYSTDPCFFAQGAATCPNGRFFDGAGIQTPASSKYHGTVEAIYETAIGDNSTLSISANWFHRASINFSAAGAPYQQLGAIDVFGANIGFDVGKSLKLAIFCKNCTNKIFPNYIGQDPGDSGLGVLSTINRFGYNSVRTIGAAITYKF